MHVHIAAVGREQIFLPIYRHGQTGDLKGGQLANRETISFFFHRRAVGDTGGEVGRGIFDLRDSDGVSGGAVGDLSTGAAAVIHNIQDVINIAPAL